MVENLQVMNNDGRIVSFDFLKLFAIYLVVLGHCVQHLLPSHPYEEPMYLYIYSFHMPLFMMISGFFSYKRELTLYDAWGGVKKRFKQLIIPCVIWSLIHLTIVYFYETNCSCLLIDYIKDEIYNTLWFLKSLFICYIIYVCLAVLENKYRVPFIMLLLILMPFLGWYHLKLMIPSFLLGALLKKYSIMDKDKLVLIIFGLLFVVCLFIWNANFLRSPEGTFSRLHQGDYIPLIIFFYRYSFSLMIGMSGSLFFVSLFHYFFKANKEKMPEKISKNGQLTLGVYIFQTFILETVLPHYLELSDNNRVVCYVVLPVVAMVITSICLLLTKFFMCNRLANLYLLGGLEIK